MLRSVRVYGRVRNCGVRWSSNGNHDTDYAYYVPMHPLPRYDNREAVNEYIKHVKEELKTVKYMGASDVREISKHMLDAEEAAKEIDCKNKLIFKDGVLTKCSRVSNMRVSGIIVKTLIYSGLSYVTHFASVPLIMLIGLIRLLDIDDHKADSLEYKLGKLKEENARISKDTKIREIVDQITQK